jgi:polar amino acid transport system substrate-binding protein
MTIDRSIALALACCALTPLPAQAADTIRVAHPIQLRPLISVKDGQTVGLVADILRAAAARAGITIVFVPLASGSMKALTDGTVDAIAPMLINAKSEEVYDFTDAFVVTGGGLFARAPNPTPDLASLGGKTVATPSFGPFVAYIHENFPSVTVVPTKSYPESLDLVVSGQAAAAALNMEEGTAVVAASYAGKITVPATMFLREPLGLAVLKGSHADLVRRLDAGLAAIRADGTLQRIEAGWNHSPVRR